MEDSWLNEEQAGMLGAKVGDAGLLVELADEVLGLHAGPGTSVAATKSFILSLTAVIHLATNWRADKALDRALMQGWISATDTALEAKKGGLYFLYVIRYHRL